MRVSNIGPCLLFARTDFSHLLYFRIFVCSNRGGDWKALIARNACNCKVFVLFLTAKWTMSEFCTSELKLALENGRKILPYILPVPEDKDAMFQIGKSKMPQVSLACFSLLKCGYTCL